MFASLKPWCRFPVLIHKYDGMTGSGDAKFKAPVEYSGYPVELTELITDKNGKQYMSRLRVYFPETVPIAVEDMIAFPDDALKREVRKLGGFSDGNTGKRDIWVVYL